jgi:hypothetical protein
MLHCNSFVQSCFAQLHDLLVCEALNLAARRHLRFRVC